jgi:hypothetical protein
VDCREYYGTRGRDVQASSFRREARIGVVAKVTMQRGNRLIVRKLFRHLSARTNDLKKRVGFPERPSRGF